MSTALKDQILRRLEALPEDKLKYALKWLNHLASSRPPAMPGKNLHRFAGTLSAEDAEQMNRAAEECRPAAPSRNGVPG